MRTLIWSGTALVLMCGAGFFVGASHATRHPQSFLGRCALSVYRVWNPAPETPAQLACPGVAPTPGHTPTAAGRLTPNLDVVESIVVAPTEVEPPVAFPRLSPEITAAIERLRQDEESETPAQPFDGPAGLRMPYADEDVEVLPEPAATEVSTSQAFYFTPTACWQLVYDKVTASLSRFAEVSQGNDEASDAGTPEESSSSASELRQIPFDHYHGHSCPYSGGCPAPYHYRNMRK